MRTQRNGLSFCTLLVMALVLIGAFQTVSVQGGRAMKEDIGSGGIPFNPLNPGSTPGTAGGLPYPGRGCQHKYYCDHPPAADP
ncbi:unnamed protein product [Alopecurus aequalis]